MKLIFLLAVALFFAACSIQEGNSKTNKYKDNMEENKELDTITFGAGCFWCTEAVFERIKGVKSVVSGYMGGHVENPSYEAVCSGSTGHAEVVQVRYNPEAVSFPELLEIFWKTHDPTTLNRQGADVGTQYRSVIFCENEMQLSIAKKYKDKLEESGAFDKPIVTEIQNAGKFYEAEANHQNYFARNPGQGYCQFVIVPKIKKLENVFSDKLKE